MIVLVIFIMLVQVNAITVAISAGNLSAVEWTKYDW